MPYHVTVDRTEPQTVLELRRIVRPDHAGDDIGAGMQALFEVAAAANLLTVGPPSTTYLGDFGSGEPTAVDFGIAVTFGAGEGRTGECTLRRTEPTRTARTVHRGDYSRLGQAYDTLQRWLSDSGYRPIGPPTELYLVGPEAAVGPGDLVTEIRIPVVAEELSIRVTVPFDDTVARTRQALADNGFTVLTDIDMQAALSAESGVETGPFRLLGACNPQLAHRVLAIDSHLGPLLACQVGVRAEGGHTVVEALDPELLTGACETAKELEPIARLAREALAAALHAIEHHTTAVDR